jgi:hypothetical protein
MALALLVTKKTSSKSRKKRRFFKNMVWVCSSGV